MFDHLRPKYEERIRALAAFGHRGSATPNEQRASDYLCDELKAIGLEPTREAFAGSRSLGARVLIHVLVAAIGAACFWSVPVLSIVLGLISVASLWVEQTTRGVWLSRPFVKYPSSNIIARIPAIAPKLRMIVCGHYDTQRTGFMWILFAYFGPLFWWVPAILKPPMMPLGLIMVGQGVLAIVAMIHGVTFELTIVNAAILVVYAGAILLLGEWSVERFIPGAGDNATGASGVITIAEAWLSEPRDDIELVLVLLGCEEGGLLGSAAWADRHRNELESLPTVFVNLDNLGFGPPRFFRSEVPQFGIPVPYPPAMIEAAKETAKELGLENAGPHSMPGPTDALSFLTRGMQGVSVVSFRKWGFMPTYHRLLDTTENLDFDAAWQAVVFSEALLQRLITQALRQESTLRV